MERNQAVEWVAERARTLDEDGQTMAEYALVLSLISAAVIFSITTIGTTLSGFFTSFTVGL